MKKLTFIILVLCLFAGVANAQRSLVAFEYSMSFGTGDLADFNGSSSFRGFTFDWRKYVTPEVAVGLDAGWNVYYDERASETYTIGTASLTGKQYRYQNQVPIMFATDYFFKPGKKVNPFAGFGIGTMYSSRRTEMNLYSIKEDTWHFAIRPEVGMLVELNPESSVFIALKYYYGLSGGDLDQPQSYIALNVGIAIMN